MDTISRRIHELHAEGRARWRAGRITEAERVYRAMVDEARAAGEGLPAALRADAHHWMAHFYRDTGNSEAAEAFAREAITLERFAPRLERLAHLLRRRHHDTRVDLVVRPGLLDLCERLRVVLHPLVQLHLHGDLVLDAERIPGEDDEVRTLLARPTPVLDAPRMKSRWVRSVRITR